MHKIPQITTFPWDYFELRQYLHSSNSIIPTVETDAIFCKKFLRVRLFMF